MDSCEKKPVNLQCSGPRDEKTTTKFVVLTITVPFVIFILYTVYTYFSLEHGDEYNAKKELLLGALRGEVVILGVFLMAYHGLNENKRRLVVPFMFLVTWILFMISGAMIQYSFLIIRSALVNGEVNTSYTRGAVIEVRKKPIIPGDIIVISILWLTYTAIKINYSALKTFLSLYKYMGQQSRKMVLPTVFEPNLK